MPVPAMESVPPLSQMLPTKVLLPPMTLVGLTSVSVPAPTLVRPPLLVVLPVIGALIVSKSVASGVLMIRSPVPPLVMPPRAR